jgi:hypothetical protein
MELYKSREEWPGIGRFLSSGVARRRWVKYALLPKIALPWLWRFLYMYFLRGGILDRRPGLTLCFFISSYEFFIRAKYLELKRLRGREPVVRGLAVREGTASDETDPQASVSSEAAAEAPAPIRFTPKPGVATSLSPVSVLVRVTDQSPGAIDRCLDHLRWADEVIVRASDAGSIDVRNDWVLEIAADEWVTPELADEIAAAVRSQRFGGYYINRRLIFMGGWVRWGGFYPDWSLRLSRRSPGQNGRLNNDLLDLASPTVRLLLERENRRSEQRMKQMSRQGGVGAASWVPFRSTLRFLHRYIWKGGFLDGRPGYIACRLASIGDFLAEAKYIEACRADADAARTRELSAVPAARLSERSQNASPSIPAQGVPGR